MGYGMQQVSLTEAYLRVDIERVVDQAGRFGNSCRGRVGELVRIADDKSVEREAGPKTGPLQPSRGPGRFGFRAGLGVAFPGDCEFDVKRPFGHALDHSRNNGG